MKTLFNIPTPCRQFSVLLILLFVFSVKDVSGQLKLTIKHVGKKDFSSVKMRVYDGEFFQPVRGARIVVKDSAKDSTY